MNSYSKAFFLKLILFVSFLIASFSIFNYFISENVHEPIQYKLKYQELFKCTYKANGIIIGSSHIAHAMRPSQLDESNVHFYNFGLAAASPSFFLDWYTNLFISNYDRPKYCIIGVDWFMFNENILPRKFEHDAEFFSSKMFLKLLISGKCDRTDLLFNRFPITKYRNRFSELLSFYSTTTYLSDSEYDRGYIPYEISESLRSYKVDIPMDGEVSTQRVIDFIQLLSALRSSDVRIVLIMTPEYAIDSGVYEKMKSIMVIKTIAKWYNIPFCNFNTDYRSEINDNILYFGDWGHLNSTGSSVFSKLVKKRINELL